MLASSTHSLRRIAAHLRASLCAMSDEEGEKPAHLRAALAGDVSAVEAWLSDGGDVNLAPSVQQYDPYGSLLSAAILGRQTQMREYLVARGARCGKYDVYIHCAQILTSPSYLDVARLLIEHGADPAMGNELFSTWGAQHKLAVMASQDATTLKRRATRCALLIRLLVEKGAAVDPMLGGNTRFAFGTTSLMVAAFYSAPVVYLRELLRLGADLSATNGRGESALSLARSTLHDPAALGDLEDKQAVFFFLRDVSAAGTFKRYVNEPRKSLLLLSKLCERGRATAPRRGALARLFPTRRSRRAGEGLPDVLFWKVLSFWRTERDGP